MLQPIDADEFLRNVTPPLRAGDAAQLARTVQLRWRVSELCRLLEHPNVDVRRVAAVTIGLVGDRSVVGCLARALQDRDEQVNQMAEHGLWAIWFRLGDPCAAEPFRRGVALMAAEKFRASIDCFEEAHRLDPGFAEAFNQCAIAHFFLFEWDQSIADCERAVRLMPMHFGAIAGMGHCHTQRGDLEKARYCYYRALEINPRMPTITRMIDRLEARQRSSNDRSGIYSYSGVPDGR